MMNGIGPMLVVLALAVVTARAEDLWTLERLLEHATLQNPDVRIARQRVAAAQAGVQEASSAFWPRLQLQAGYSRTDNPMMTFGSILNQRSYQPALDFNNVPDVDNFNVRGAVHLPLYSGGRNVAGREAARANVRASRQEAISVTNTIAFEVVRGFHTVLKTRQFVRAGESSVGSMQAGLALAEKRFEAGTLLRSDVLDIEVRLGQAREELIRARNANSIARHSLRNLLGIEDAEFDVAGAAPAVEVPADVRVTERAEAAAARDRVRAAEAQVRMAGSIQKPRVSLFGAVDEDKGWRTGGEGRSYSAGMLAQWDLWDGFLGRSKVSQARAGLDIAREEQRKIGLAIGLEVEQARLNLAAAKERLQVTGRSVAQAEESAALIRKRFEQGLALSAQLLESENALLSARVRRAEAESDRQIAIAAMRKALALPQLDKASTGK